MIKRKRFSFIRFWLKMVLTSNSYADVAVGSADNFSVAPSTQVSSFAKLVCNFVIIPMAFSHPINLFYPNTKHENHEQFRLTPQ